MKIKRRKFKIKKRKSFRVEKAHPWGFHPNEIGSWEYPDTGVTFKMFFHNNEFWMKWSNDDTYYCIEFGNFFTNVLRSL